MLVAGKGIQGLPIAPSAPSTAPIDNPGSEQTLYPPRVVSGIQPTPAVHLGHYFGALKQHIELQHEYPGEAFFVIADYHALTRNSDPTWIRNSTLELASSYLALGLDPNKAILYRQSDVPQTLQLFWILSCLSGVSELARVPTFSDFSGNQTAGLLTYPILMAADVLALRATIVPVGSDQTINMERVRHIATKFNRVYGAGLFPLPRTRIPAIGKILGTDRHKMAHLNKNAISPFDSFTLLQQRVKAIVTDGIPRGTPRDPNDCLVFHLYSLVASPERVASLRTKYETGDVDYADAKRDLTISIMEYFSEAVDRYQKYRKQPDFVKDVLREGVKCAAEQISTTLEAVRQLTGLAI